MSRPRHDAPVVALDLDGTSGDYHGHFIWFMEQYVGKPMPPRDQYTGGVPFHKFLSVSRKTYNEGKLAFRQGGYKRFMPIYEGIGDFTRHVRRSGAQLWICTTRPYQQLPTVDGDTRHWMRRAGIQHDAVLYGPHKYRDLVDAVGADRVLCVIDDLPEMCEQAMRLDLTAVLRSQPYNTWWATPTDHGMREEGSSGRLFVARSVEEYQTTFDALMKEHHDG